MLKKNEISTLALNLILLLVSLSIGQLFGQQPLNDQQAVYPTFTNEAITLDGKLTEAIWQSIPPTGNFWQNFPKDTIRAVGQTELRVAYNDKTIYLSVKCYSVSNQFFVPSFKRDYSTRGMDAVTFVFDTFNDKTNAFLFSVNPTGAQRESLIANGGSNPREDMQTSWDNKWYSEAKVYDNYWIAEVAIPFNTLRFNAESKEWNFTCYRNDTQHNEYSTWQQIPRNRRRMDLSYTGKMIWETPPQKPKRNISIIPYAIAGRTRNFESTTQLKANTTADIGVDAKIALSSSLNLDVTINPDFSQVEVDEQVTNLDRFEISFPEKRQFFLENADLFGSFGLTRVNPFFSRRIGIALDTLSGQNVLNPISYGLRLTGKLNENFRVGLINMQAAKLENTGLPAFNYTVAALQHKVFNRSNISFIFANKQAVKANDNPALFNNFNRVAGLEYRHTSADNRWRGKTFYHHSFSPEQAAHPFTHGLQLEYQKRKYRFEWAHLLIGNGYNAEVGFVPRNDYMLFSPEGALFFYPQNGPFNLHTLQLDTRFFRQIGKNDNEIIDPWGEVERQFELEWTFNFINNTRGSITITNNDLTLLKDFDPTRLQADDIFLSAGSHYHYINVEGRYTSDQRKKLFAEIRPNFGQFYNGNRYGLRGELTYQFQPFGSIAFNWNYNYVKLAAPFKPAKIWLVGPKLDITFNKKLFWSTFVQYNNQLDNLNINTRLQWRFAPVSDFFLVYTDNYLTDSFSQFEVRNRGLVAKFTYWLNL